MTMLPEWFNDSVYMQSKAKQAGLTVAATRSAFEKAGFYGEDGDFVHFINYGQWEDVSPIATFDPEYYYRSKAASVYNIDISQITTSQAQFIKDAIKNAGMNAWSHYQLYGTREGIDASAGFDTSAYMETKLAQVKKSDPGFTMDMLYDAFASAGLSAAAHYEAYGKSEGLKAVEISEPTPTNSYTAKSSSDSVTFTDGVADTFATKFGTGRTHVQSWDLADIALGTYGHMRVSDSAAILTYRYIAYGDSLFMNTTGVSLSGKDLAESVATSGMSPLGWNMSYFDSTLIFTATNVPSGPYYYPTLDSLYGAYSYSSPYYDGNYRHIIPTSVVEGIIGKSSTSSLLYSNYYDTIYCDTISGFNPAEDRIAIPTKVNSLVRGVLTSLSELLCPIQISANQAKLFEYESEYYLLVNDTSEIFDVNVDITIKLIGLSNADAANMTADIFV